MRNAFELVGRKRPRKRNSENLKEKTLIKYQNNFLRKLEKALEEFEVSQFCFDLLQTIDTCLASLGLSSIKEILCYGIGSFLENKSSLHQLAALIKFHKKYNSTVDVYDPVFTSVEIESLRNLNFNVLPENEEGKRKIGGSQGILVFLPHCPKQLTNNFLWANWNSSLCNCILVANSFSRIVQDNTKKVLQESAEYILTIQPKTTEIALEDSYLIKNIFNDTSVHYFNPQDLQKNFFTETLKKEPAYSDNIELVTKNIKEIDINNGE